MTINYFAYGSNMDPERMRSRNIQVISFQSAILDNHSLVFNKIAWRKPDVGYANIIKSKGSFVQGILYRIEETGLSELDEYEGCPIHYSRKKVSVLVNDNYNEAITYVAAPGKTADNLKPTSDYMSHLLAAERWLFPEYIDYLKSFDTLESFDV